MHQNLVDFASLFKGSVKQRSKAWVAEKSHGIGGSEIATLFGMNTYQNSYDLLSRKVGLEEFYGSTATQWGTFFEPCTERFVEIDQSTTIVGSDIFISRKRSGLPRHGNSPDGFCVVEIDGEPMPALLELKAPYSRIPDGKVPKHYLPQLWSGLWVSPTWKGVFVDAAIRLCGREDLGFSGVYLEDYHVSRHRKKPQWPSARAWGVTAVYLPQRDFLEAQATMDENLSVMISYIQQQGCGEGIDLSELPHQMINWIFRYCTSGELEYKHSDPQWGERSVNEVIDAFPRENLLGYLPWKFMQVEYVVVDVKTDFAEKAAPLLEEFFQEVYPIREANNKAEAFMQFCARTPVFCGQVQKKEKDPLDLIRAPRASTKSLG